MNEIRTLNDITPEEDGRNIEEAKRFLETSGSIAAVIALAVIAAISGQKKAPDSPEASKSISAGVTNAVQVAMDSDPDAWVVQDATDQLTP